MKGLISDSGRPLATSAPLVLANSWMLAEHTALCYLFSEVSDMANPGS